MLGQGSKSRFGRRKSICFDHTLTFWDGLWLVKHRQRCSDKKIDRQWVGLLAKHPRFVLSCNWLTTLVALFRWNLRTLFGRSSFAHIGMVLLFDDHPVVWTQHNFWFSADSRESVACLDDPYFLYGLSNVLVGYDEIL